MADKQKQETWLRGRCLCGRVSFKVKDEILYAGFCHCSECRRFSGAACSPNAGVLTENLAIVEGNEWIKTYEKTELSTMCFCGNCGSSLFVKKPRWGRVHIRLGCLQDTPSLTPATHYHVASKAVWEMIVDDLPQFDRAPPRD